jgi:hypothetical protein
MVAHHTVKTLKRLKKGLAKAESAVEVLRARVNAARIAVRKHAVADGLATDSDDGSSSSSSSSDSDDGVGEEAARAGSSHEGVVPAIGIEDAPDLPPAEIVPVEVTERALALLTEPGLAHPVIVPPHVPEVRPAGLCLACWYRRSKRAGGSKHAFDLTCGFTSSRVKREGFDIASFF